MIFVIKFLQEFIITVSFTGKNSAKVFSSLSWNWSSKSLQVTKEDVELYGSSEPCRVGAHCITLKKLYAAEQRLYKEMKVRSSLDDRAHLVRMCNVLQRHLVHMPKGLISSFGLAHCSTNIRKHCTMRWCVFVVTFKSVLQNCGNLA